MNTKAKVHTLAMITTLLWGTSYPLVRLIGDELSNGSIAFIRTFMVAVIVTAIGLKEGMKLPQKLTDLLWFLLGGICGYAATFVLINMGLETITSATTSIVYCISPIFSVLIVNVIYRERLNLTGWISLFAALAGVAVMLLWNGVFSVKIGIVWVTLSAFCFAVFSVLTRKLTEDGYTATEITVYSAAFGCLVLIPFLPGTVTEFIAASMTSQISVLFLGILSSGIAYYTWNKALALTDRTSVVTNYLFLNPLTTTVIGLFLVREIPDLGVYIGGGITVLSMVVFTLKGKK